MFSIFLTNEVALSISSRVIDFYIHSYYYWCGTQGACRPTSVACELWTVGMADLLGRPKDLCRTWKPPWRVKAALASSFLA